VVSHPPLIVIVGATAVGKTAAAIRLAQALDGEIVSADSRQVYRQMDIGTAKPTSEQRALIAHHAVDVVDPDDTLSLAEYLHIANTAVHSIHSRGKLPFLVGGTGQYVTALTEGWSVPQVPPNPTLRAELEDFAARLGAAALGERLQALDPAALNTIDYRNVRRVIRALEVIAATGQSFSAQQTKTPPPYTVLHYGLTMPRHALYERADRRVDTMIEGGFVEEVRALLDAGYAPTLPSMSGLGYSEIAAHLIDHTPLDVTVNAIYSATHDFIRRQETWFRKYNRHATWLDAAQLDMNDWISSIQHQIDTSK
jgi:tRNA dimethylallyltransferase